MNGSDQTDRNLLDRYVAGDVSAFDAIHKKYAGLVYSVCLRSLNVPQDAEDAAAACFVVLAKKATQIEPGCGLAAWLYGCAIRSAGNAATVRRHRAERETEACNMDRIAREGRDIEWGNVVPHLERHIAALPIAQREALILRSP